MPNRLNGANSARRSSFVHSALQTYGANVAGAVLSLVSVLIVARVLGPAGRGNVAYLTSLAWFTASLFTFGLQEANANFAAAEPDARPSLATNSIVLSLVFGALAVGLLAVLIALVPAVGGEASSDLRWATLAFVPLLTLQIFLRFLAQADYAFTVANAAYLVGPVLNAALNGLFAALGILTVSTAVGVWLAGQTIGTGLLAWFVIRRLAGLGRFDASLARRALGFGLRSHLGRVMQLGNYRLDQILLGSIAGPRELGLYSVAVAWAEALWFLPTALAAVQRPDLVRIRTRIDAAAQAARAFRATALVTIVFGAAMVLLAPFLCETVFGSDFSGSVDDLRVLVSGAFGMVALKLFGNALVARGHPGLQSAAIGTGFALTVLLDVILIPELGGLGAALASAVAYTAAGVVVISISLRTLGGRAADLIPRGSDVAWFTRLARRADSGAATQTDKPAAQLPHAMADVEQRKGGGDTGEQGP